MKRRSCRDFAEARSAYVDGYLGEEERQALLAHLSDCAVCREEVAALQRLRSLLTDTGRQTGAPVPDELTHRLAAIARSDAATDRDRPRMVGTRAVPLAGVALLLVLIAGVGYAAAPADGRRDAIADPTAAVRTDFSAALAQLPLTSTAVAAALTVDPLRLGATSPELDDEPTMTGPRLDHRQVDHLLHSAAWASARVPYSGVQQVVAPRDDRTTAAEVAVDFTPADGSQVTIRTLDGEQVAGGLVPTPAASRIAGNNLISALASGYRLTGIAGGTAAGRPVALVQAWARDATVDKPAAAWWIDTDTGLVVRQQLYDHTGRLVLSARYSSLSIGAPATTGVARTPARRELTTSAALLTRPLTTATFTTASAGSLSSQGWFCHARLAGLKLVRLRADAPGEPGVLHMVYTDGLSTVSVFERRGRLVDPPSASTWDPTLDAYRTDAMVNVATWQSGHAVFTVATDGPTALRDEMVRALPHDTVPGPTTMSRIQAGWSRILHALG
ncbi:zf-HC2 domain-containing protein [Microlunatus sp. Gsoil 973]|uniref:zf-HC2 domain-containing protein n=1 Tax=Microlunatus sp. Gsoil 973 TaxID=2672569 RepID=UPI0012B49F94|nr:zf-HC2 domain-containing protein [Microlunatus sp. Gsoil 973]QGN33437.1 hypothetical protein GJV80_12135 [Microlunatus sp. Gsoil 973]